MTMTNTERECGCARTGRREFLQEGSALVAGVLTALGAGAAVVSAMPVRFGEAIGASGDERTYPVPAADGATIDRDNQVILVRFEGKAFAFLLSCPHQNTALRWLAADRRFQCPRHESKYKPDGTFIEGRATRNMDRFAIKRSGSSLVVDLGRWYQSDSQKAEWTAAVVAV
jgi:nitrite reductase/ring-hydroxylating ferredoxin subunit